MKLVGFVFHNTKSKCFLALIELMENGRLYCLTKNKEVYQICNHFV
jgi:hypothetical protein